MKVRALFFIYIGVKLLYLTISFNYNFQHRCGFRFGRALPSIDLKNEFKHATLFAVGSSTQRQGGLELSELHPYGSDARYNECHDDGLLSREEEIILARLVQKRILWEEIRLKLVKKLKREPTLTEWSRKCGQNWISTEEFVFALHKSEEAKAALINANLRLVGNLARKQKSQCRTKLQVPDLIHEGIFGLFKASEKFDPERGFRFATFATWWIRKSISRAIANHNRIVRLPVHVQESLQSIRRIQKELSAQLGRKPTEAELAQSAGITIEKLEWFFSCEARDSVSLHVNEYSTNFKLDDDNFMGGMEGCIADNELNPEESLIKASMNDHLNNLLLRLHPRERIVVRLRYGLDSGGIKENFTRIGLEVGVAKERARQIEMKAIERLKALGYSATAVADEVRSYLV